MGERGLEGGSSFFGIASRAGLEGVEQPGVGRGRAAAQGAGLAEEEGEGEVDF